MITENPLAILFVPLALGAIGTLGILIYDWIALHHR